QERRERDAPPLSRADDQVVTDGAERDQRADAEIAIPADVEGEVPLEPEHNQEKKNQAEGEERDVGDELVVADRPAEGGRLIGPVAGGDGGGRRAPGVDRWARGRWSCPTRAKGLRRHCCPRMLAG